MILVFGVSGIWILAVNHTLWSHSFGRICWKDNWKNLESKIWFNRDTSLPSSWLHLERMGCTRSSTRPLQRTAANRREWSAPSYATRTLNKVLESWKKYSLGLKSKLFKLNAIQLPNVLMFRFRMFQIPNIRNHSYYSYSFVLTWTIWKWNK